MSCNMPQNPDLTKTSTYQQRPGLYIYNSVRPIPWCDSANDDPNDVLNIPIRFDFSKARSRNAGVVKVMGEKGFIVRRTISVIGQRAWSGRIYGTQEEKGTERDEDFWWKAVCNSQFALPNEVTNFYRDFKFPFSAYLNIVTKFLSLHFWRNKMECFSIPDFPLKVLRKAVCQFSLKRQVYIQKIQGGNPRFDRDIRIIKLSNT